LSNAVDIECIIADNRLMARSPMKPTINTMINKCHSIATSYPISIAKQHSRPALRLTFRWQKIDSAARAG
jgi:hypothetical protein